MSIGYYDVIKRPFNSFFLYLKIFQCTLSPRRDIFSPVLVQFPFNSQANPMPSSRYPIVAVSQHITLIRLSDELQI